MDDKLVSASDGRLALRIKPHTIRKLQVIEYYLTEFATAMKPKPQAGQQGFEALRSETILTSSLGQEDVGFQVPQSQADWRLTDLP